MKTSIKLSSIGVAIAAIGISGISKMVSASPNSSSIAVIQQKVETPANQAKESSNTTARSWVILQ